MEMTQEEIQQKTNGKVQAIRTLCQQLEIELQGKQAITERGFIENVVFFLDKETYEVKKDKPKEEPKNDEKITDIRRPDDKTSDGVRDRVVRDSDGKEPGALS